MCIFRFAQMNRKERTQIVVSELKRLYPTLGPFLHSSNDHEFLFAVMLSAQCTDKKVNEVTKVLFSKYKTLQDYGDASLEAFTQDIKQIGLYKSKAKNILATAKKLQEDYAGKIPRMMVQLLELPGVGRKTANVVLSELFHEAQGIAVDTHVKRLANKFGLTDSQNIDRIEKDLMEVIPKHEWTMFTKRMIAYGREYSPARKKTEEDPISKLLREAQR